VDCIQLAQDMDQKLAVANTGNSPPPRVSEKKWDSQKNFVEFASTRRCWFGKNLG
jgi:hypothetical protein